MKKKWHNTQTGMIVDLNCFSLFTYRKTDGEFKCFEVFAENYNRKYNFAYFEEEEQAKEYLQAIFVELKEINDIWSSVIGEKFNPMTKVKSFANGILTVRVQNSTLLSLLNQYEKPKLLQKLKEQLLSEVVIDLIFEGI